MIVIVTFNQKGGTGKSTTVVNIAGCLSVLKKNTLVIDTDGQCTSSSYLRAIEGPTENNLNDYILKNVSAEEIIYPVRFETWDNKLKQHVPQETKISLISSSRAFSSMQFNEQFNYPDLFKDLFSSIDTSKYDYCIFDCPGYFSKLTESALRVADYIIVPAIADLDSLVGFSDLIDTKNRIRAESNNINLEVLGIVFTFFSGYSLNRQIKEYCSETMGSDIIFNTHIRRAASISDARAEGKPIVYYKPKEAVAEDYMTLTKEIMKRTKNRR